MPKPNRTFVIRVLTLFTALPLISSCDWETKTTKVSPNLVINSLTPDCFGTHCGAFDSSTYTGRDYGIWTFTNNSNVSTQLPMKISGTDGHDLTLTFTNISETEQPMTAIQLSPDQLRTQTLSSSFSPKRVRHENLPVRKPQRKGVSAHAVHTPSVVGDTLAWWVEDDDGDDDNNQRDTTLIAQAEAPDHRIVNIWVENSEYAAGKITPAIITQIIQKFITGKDAGGTQVMVPGYQAVIEHVGQPWGPHDFAMLIPDSGELDIVLVNFKADGLIESNYGYFWSNNNFLNGNGETTPSNERLSFYLDTETFYLLQGGVTTQLKTLVHEMTHMANYYNRGIKRNFYFNSYLEETSALMMEDIAFYMDTSDNSLKWRYLDWLIYSDLNCAIFEWDSDPNSACYGYSSGGAMGAYLLRHFGVKFYRDLLTYPSDEPSVLLNTLLKKYGQSLSTTLPRVASQFSVLDWRISPNFYGLPPTLENVYVSLAGIGDGNDIQYQNLPHTVPTTLKAYGSFPVIRNDLSGDYQETVEVPPHTTLTVLVK